MFTLEDLTGVMEKSGRRLTPRTARNWWTVGLLPRPRRTGLGRGRGTVSFWQDRRVATQAGIAHDLLGRGVSLQGTTAGLWLLGFPAPLDRVQAAFVDQIAGLYRRGKGSSRDGLEAGLWQQVQRFVRSDARARGGSPEDDEGVALHALTGGLLELLCGVGDSAPEPGDSDQWSVDTAAELLFQIEVLKPFTQRYGEIEFPVIQAETVEEVAIWICQTASLQRQHEAVAQARQHEWIRARRLVRVAIELADRADAAASPQQHEKNRMLFTRLAVGWARLLFPILLAVVRAPEQRRSVTNTLFAAAAIVRRGPVTTLGNGFWCPPPQSAEKLPNIAGPAHEAVPTDGRYFRRLFHEA